MTRASAFIVVLAMLVACERPGSPERARQLAGRALSGTLTYPASTMVSLSAGEEAVELVMSSADSMSVIVKWFQRALPLNHWDVKRTTNEQSGNVTIYAEQRKRPLWIRLQPNVGGPGTTYRMVGVIPGDSTKP
jgi:hypothetical protein